MDASDVRQFFIAALQNDSTLADLNTSPNSDFDDIVVKPHMLFSQAIFNMITNYQKTISLGNLQNLTTAQLTAIAHWMSVTINTTSTLTLAITIYLNASNNQTLTIETTDAFRCQDGTVFNPIQMYVFVPSALPLLLLQYHHLSF